MSHCSPPAPTALTMLARRHLELRLPNNLSLPAGVVDTNIIRVKLICCSYVAQQSTRPLSAKATGMRSSVDVVHDQLACWSAAAV
jgi:hypothetical protein